MIMFTVHGQPAPQGSKSYLGASKGGRPRFRESSEKVAPWRVDVRDAAEKAMTGQTTMANVVRRPLDGPVAVWLSFRLARPKGHHGTGRNADKLKASAPIAPAGTPDVDKLARAVLDALTGVVYVDDAQVVDLYLVKRYADLADPGVDVRVRTL